MSVWTGKSEPTKRPARGVSACVSGSPLRGAQCVAGFPAISPTGLHCVHLGRRSSPLSCQVSSIHPGSAPSASPNGGRGGDGRGAPRSLVSRLEPHCALLSLVSLPCGRALSPATAVLQPSSGAGGAICWVPGAHRGWARGRGRPEKGCGEAPASRIAEGTAEVMPPGLSPPPAAPLLPGAENKKG